MKKSEKKKYKRAPTDAERSLSSEVDELVGSPRADAGEKNARLFERSAPIADDDFTAERAQKKRRVSAGAVVFRTLLILILLLLAGCVAIMEPWAPAEDRPDGDPDIEKLAPRAIAAGEVFKPEVPLGANERISETVVSDTTLLALTDDGVVGVGEYFEPVTLSITTMEKEVLPKEPKRKLVIGVRDFSEPLDSARSWLRDLVGIEKREPERTEPMVLHRYEQQITVTGLDPVTVESDYSIESYLGEAVSVELAVGEGLTPVARSLNESTAAVGCERENRRATLTVTGAAAGKTKAVVDFGFYKEVDAETYARYLEWETSEPDALSRSQGEGGETDAPQTPRIFVPTSRLELPVSVIDPDEPVVHTELNATDEKTASEYGGGYASALAEKTLALVNEARRAQGLAELEWSGELENLADERAKALADSFVCDPPEGSSAELIGLGFESARAAVDAWLAVPQTRDALLSEGITGFGCSLWRESWSGYDSYWCAETA